MGPGSDIAPDSSPIVSVIMSVFNGGAYLRPAVQSVVDQTMRDWELIVVDDGSTDGAVGDIAKIDDARIRILRQENRGKSAAMNRALAQARGKYYALNDADDISHPTRLERQAACLDAHPQVVGVFCCHDIILDGRVLAPTMRAKSIEMCARDIAEERMPGHDPTAMYRLSIVRGIDYAEDLRVAQGVDYILRVGEKFPLMLMGECLYSYRVHKESITLSKVEMRVKLREEVVARARLRRGQPYSAEERSRTLARLSRRGPDNDLVSHFCASVADLVRLGRRRQAIEVGLASWRRNPFAAYNAKPLVYALLPAGVVHAYKSVRRNVLGR